MTSLSDDYRLGRLEGRVEEQAKAMREIRQDLRSGSQQVDARFDRMDAPADQTGNRIDWQFLTLLGIGAAQIGLLITLILRGG